ncbi:MAG: hypothetical protein HWD61_13575 [Parachlamydiaceae bacterium]|nr:MAG: hypothetical protein HWD61_13575 [Parachlamydiaceae bacterium]
MAQENTGTKNEILQDVFVEMCTAVENLNRDTYKQAYNPSRPETNSSRTEEKYPKNLKETLDNRVKEKQRPLFPWETYNPSFKSETPQYSSETPDPFKSPVDSPDLNVETLFKPLLSKSSQTPNKEESFSLKKPLDEEITVPQEKIFESSNRPSKLEEKQTNKNIKASDLKLEDLTDDNIKDFDFSTIPLSEEIINRLFRTRGFASDASKRLPTISKENLVLIAPYFSDDHWRYLSDLQVNEFDFSTLQGNEKQKQNIVDTLFIEAILRLKIEFLFFQ